jgi:hypothetical protein
MSVSFPEDRPPNYLSDLLQINIKKAKRDEVQNKVHPSLPFRFNSINVFIGQRGSGKTHLVFTFLAQLSHLKALRADADPDFDIMDLRHSADSPSFEMYSQAYFGTNKTHDDTVSKFLPHIDQKQLQVIKVKHDELLDLFKNLDKTKTLLRMVQRENRRKTRQMGIIDEDGENEDSSNHENENEDENEEKDSSNEIIQVDRMMGSTIRRRDVEEFPSWGFDVLHVLPTVLYIPHTIMIADDCQDLFKNNVHLMNKLFENRQPRITVFALLQDPQGLPTKMKSNVDLIVIFGGYPRHKIGLLFHQLPPLRHLTVIEFWERYRLITSHQYILIDFREGENDDEEEDDD